MGKKLCLLLSFLLALVVSAAGVALAQPELRQQQALNARDTLDKEGVIDSGVEVQAARPGDQDGGLEGHLPPRQSNVRVVGKAKIAGVREGQISDVNFFKSYAYLGSFDAGDCTGGGVYVLDIKNLSKPEEVGFIPAAEGSYVGEGVQVIRIDTPQYRGDVLIHNNEICDATSPTRKGGVSLFDVTNPRKPQPLAEGVGDTDPESFYGPGVAHTVHSAFAWDAGRKAYAVLVDNEEGADVDILDISDPRNPELIKEYNLNEEFPQIIQEDLGSNESFLHDVIVKKIKGRWVMLLSYWDGGYVQLDVTDPRNATYIGDSDFNNPDPEALESGFTVEPEGNAHQAEFSKKNDFFVGADEDFSPYSIIARNVTDGTAFDATQGSNTPQIDRDTTLEGRTIFVGRACNSDPAVPPAPDDAKIAVVERGACSFTEKVANVEKAGGYEGVIVFNSQAAAGGSCTGLVNMSVEGNIPALFVGRDTGFSLFNQPYDDAACADDDPTTGAFSEPAGTKGDSVKIEAIFDGWGYVHLFKSGSGKFEELDTYAIPEAHDPRFAEGFGDLSVHEVAMSERRNDLAYFSYYAGGFRVAKMQGNRLVEVGSFIDEGGNNFWGVQVLQRKGKEYVLASDRDYGLYVLRYTGRK